MFASLRKVFPIGAMCAALVVATPAIAAESTAPASQVDIATSAGHIVVQLDPERAPLTVRNFLSYVDEGHYRNTVFHRIIPGFMIQGGGYDSTMNLKAAPRKVKNEAANGLRNGRYSIAMARTADPDSASAQFFINVADNKFLDYPGQDGFGYTVFGQVIAGQNVVDQIGRARTGPGDRPVEPITIENVTRVTLR